jgi:flagellar motor switch protein FliG
MNVLSDFIIRVNENTTLGKNKNENEEIKEILDTAGKLAEQTGELLKKSAEKAAGKLEKTISKSKKLTFDDIKNMSDSAVKKLIKEIDIKDLAIAMQEAEKEIEEKVLKNLGKRAAKQYGTILNELKKVKKSDIKKYRNVLDKKMKTLFKR